MSEQVIVVANKQIADPSGWLLTNEWLTGELLQNHVVPTGRPARCHSSQYLDASNSQTGSAKLKCFSAAALQLSSRVTRVLGQVSAA